MILEVSATTFGPGRQGGGERHFHEFVRELGRHAPVLASFALPAGEPDPFGGSAVLPAWFARLPPFVGSTNPVPTIGSLRAIRTAVRRHRDEIEFLHLHNFRTSLAAAWLLIARLGRDGAKFRVVMTDHIARFVPFPRLGARLVDYYAPVSRVSEAQLLALARRPSRIIPTAVSPEFLSSDAPAAWTDRDVDLLVVGRFVPWKRADRAIRLAERVASRAHRPVRLVLAGAPERPDFVRALEAQVARSPLAASIEIVVGPTDEVLLGLYRRARFLLLLSSGVASGDRGHSVPEMAPITLLEAAASGTPVLASSTPALRDQVRPGETGTVIDESDDRAAAEAIQAALGDPSAWSRMSTGARRYVETHRTYPVIARQFLDFLADIRGGRV